MMSHDRFVYWTSTLRPTREEIQQTLQCYLGEAATRVYWDDESHRFYAILAGKLTYPFEWDPSIPREKSRYWDLDDRIIEVFLHDGADDPRPSLNVITRQADELTSVISDGFARLCARRWNGTWDER